MFFPAFENVPDSLTTPFCNRTSYTRLKPAFLSSINTQSSSEDGPTAESSKVLNTQVCSLFQGILLYSEVYCYLV